MANAGGDGIDVLQHRRIFYADDVDRGLGLDEFARYDVGESLGLGDVAASYREIGEAFHGHFLRVGRAADAGNAVVGHTPHLMEVFRHHDVLIGNNALDGRNDVLVAQRRGEFLQVILQVGRRGYEHQGVVIVDDTVDVA